MSRTGREKVCDKNCFECPFEDCIYDELDMEDFKEQRERDADHKAAMKTEKERRIAAKQRAYYEANREDIAAKQRAYREANREDLIPFGRCIADARKQRGYTQRDVAALLGVSRQLVSHIECGRAFPPMEALFGVFPELKTGGNL